jgi:lysophospholipase L1-like esterase
MKSLLFKITLSFLCSFMVLADDRILAKELPKVLIMGDSISIGYTPHVIENLKSVAEVRRHKGNAGPTIRGVARIEEWLGKGKWDLIHFNWGLWDMYGWEYHKEDRSPEAYGKRLESLVGRLKKTGAKLIWATTTPACPAKEKTMERRFKQNILISPELERKYLETALAVMNKHGVGVNDLHAFMKPRWKKYAIAENNVHFTKLGSRKLGEQVAKAIQSVLSAKASESRE